jgi:hypothetical protein
MVAQARSDGGCPLSLTTWHGGACAVGAVVTLPYVRRLCCCVAAPSLHGVHVVLPTCRVCS